MINILYFQNKEFHKALFDIFKFSITGIIICSIMLYMIVNYVMLPGYYQMVFRVTSKDLSTVMITVCKESTFNTYRTIIYGNGKVSCEVKGTIKILYISEQEVRKIINFFEEAEYFNLKDNYDENSCQDFGTDMPTIKTSIAIKGKNKSVLDYLGQDCSPPKLRKLEGEINDIIINKLENWMRSTNKSYLKGVSQQLKRELEKERLLQGK